MALSIKSRTWSLMQRSMSLGSHSSKLARIFQERNRIMQERDCEVSMRCRMRDTERHLPCSRISDGHSISIGIQANMYNLFKNAVSSNPCFQMPGNACLTADQAQRDTPGKDESVFMKTNACTEGTQLRLCFVVSCSPPLSRFSLVFLPRQK